MTLPRIARLFFAAALIGTTSTLPVSAQEPAQPSPRIIVAGEGVVSAAPDMAILTLSVVREAETAREAVTSNNAAMAEVIAALKDAGIAEADLQTSGFSVQPRYSWPDPNLKDGPRDPQIIGYTAQNSLSARIRKLEDTGVVLDRAVTLGVNSASGIVFTNDDPSAFLAQARTKAMQDAVARAGTLAEAAGVSVGKIVEISEQAYMPQPMPIARGKMMMEAADAAVPVEGGQNDYRITVNAIFEIAQ